MFAFVSKSTFLKKNLNELLFFVKLEIKGFFFQLFYRNQQDTLIDTKGRHREKKQQEENASEQKHTLSRDKGTTNIFIQTRENQSTGSITTSPFFVLKKTSFFFLQNSKLFVFRVFI